MSCRFVVGDTRDVTATLPDNSIDLILTSPPFLALRSYLPADHPDKWREIGSEATPAAFIDMLLELTAEWGRVLAPHGSICVELGDTYSGSGGAGGDYNDGGLRDGQQAFAGSAALATNPGRAGARYHGDGHNKSISARPSQDGMSKSGTGWPLAKSKALIPELYRIALAYGLNPLTGAPSPAGQWRVRNVVTWCRPNPPVGALGDKYRPATSDMVIACKSDRRWFDLDAVRYQAPDQGVKTTNGPKAKVAASNTVDNPDDPWVQVKYDVRLNSNPAGAPPLDYWVIPPGGYQGAHYATFPAELCRIPILSMCPRHVCLVCGEPRRRIVESHARYVDGSGLLTSEHARQQRGVHVTSEAVGHNNAKERVATTLGWSDCGHGSFRRGVVLDPFAGSGTTLIVATGNDRDAIGIDIDSRNADLAVERLGMFVTIEHHTGAVA